PCAEIELTPHDLIQLVVYFDREERVRPVVRVVRGLRGVRISTGIDHLDRPYLEDPVAGKKLVAEAIIDTDRFARGRELRAGGRRDRIHRWIAVAAFLGQRTLAASELRPARADVATAIVVVLLEVPGDMLRPSARGIIFNVLLARRQLEILGIRVD